MLKKTNGLVKLIMSSLLITLTSLEANELPDTAIDVEMNEQETDQELLDELLGIVDEGTEIATQTRMNTNFVPGTVTVLQGKDRLPF